MPAKNHKSRKNPRPYARRMSIRAYLDELEALEEGEIACYSDAYDRDVDRIMVSEPIRYAVKLG